MARYQVILAYDGTQFAGYQRQAGARTVQGVVEAALASLGWTGAAILAAGRTDTGVHAAGQTIAFDLDWRHTPEALVQALNAHLPADVAAQAAQTAPGNFHPRYWASARTYRYRLVCQPTRSPLRERFAWRVWPPPSGEALQAAANCLNGAHDFAAFGTPPRPGGSTVRTVQQAVWQPQADEWTFCVTANAFLYHMVRRIVFLQVLVGQGKVALAGWRRAIDQQESLNPGLAPPHGLTLWEVRYDLERPPINVKNGYE